MEFQILFTHRIPDFFNSQYFQWFFGIIWALLTVYLSRPTKSGNFYRKLPGPQIAKQ